MLDVSGEHFNSEVSARVPDKSNFWQSLEGREVKLRQISRRILELEASTFESESIALNIFSVP